MSAEGSRGAARLLPTNERAPDDTTARQASWRDGCGLMPLRHEASVRLDAGEHCWPAIIADREPNGILTVIKGRGGCRAHPDRIDAAEAASAKGKTSPKNLEETGISLKYPKNICIIIGE